MLHKHDAVSLFKAAIPAALPTLGTYPPDADDKLLSAQVMDCARYVRERAAAGDAEGFEALFAAVDELLTEGNEEAKQLAGGIFLNVLFVTTGRTPPIRDAIGEQIGPASEHVWQQLAENEQTIQPLKEQLRRR